MLFPEQKINHWSRCSTFTSLRFGLSTVAVVNESFPQQWAIFSGAENVEVLS
jgi:hypothetical protein